jgi:hypothetical protein
MREARYGPAIAVRQVTPGLAARRGVRCSRMAARRHAGTRAAGGGSAWLSIISIQATIAAAASGSGAPANR